MQSQELAVVELIEINPPEQAEGPLPEPAEAPLPERKPYLCRHIFTLPPRRALLLLPPPLPHS
jgi:hypothetical protein